MEENSKEEKVSCVLKVTDVETRNMEACACGNSEEGIVSGVLEVTDVETRREEAYVYKTTSESSNFDFTKKSWSSDLVLIVEGTKLFVSKNILSLASPVFFAMFQSDFKVGSSDEMELPGKRKRDVVEFLGCLYPNIMSEVSGEAATRILPLAEEYQVLQLKQRCEKVFLDSVKTDASTEQLSQNLQQACMYNLERLRVRCVQLLSNKPVEQLLEAKHKFHPIAKSSNEMVLNLMNKCIEDGIGKLQARCVEMNEESEALKRFILAQLEMGNDLDLNKSQNWKEKLIFLPFLLSKSTKCEKTVELWGKSLSVCIECTTQYFSYSISKTYLNLIIILKEESSVTCDVGIRCFLVSGRKGTSNKSFSWLKKLKKDTREIECKLVRMCDVKSEEGGFIHDGKLCLLVQLIMSEPM